MMTLSEKLIYRLRAECEIKVPDGTIIRRTYAGRNQKAGGAWAWYLWHNETDKILELGSCYTVTELCGSSKIKTVALLGGAEVFPVETGGMKMRSEEEVRRKLNETRSDKRLPPPCATVFENAPLALIQLELETKIEILKWFLKEK